MKPSLKTYNLKLETSEKTLSFWSFTLHASRSKIRGFTLVETLVAIAILSLAITGPLVIAEKGLSSSLYAQNEVTATYLAQDAIEYVRNVRDTNLLASPAAPWLEQFVAAGCMGGGTTHCQIDTTNTNFSSAITTCTNSSTNSALCGTPINFDSTNGWYSYAPPNPPTNTIIPTIFTRTVDVSYVPGTSNNEAIVTATVSWQTSIYTATQSVTVSEHIFNI
ncbi:MAG TPA: prepilin-type N-terminal cleavage/methylation domain-containing protein [Candidatus Paceibacterota bacterium]|nr:prepilin-type N-terminal cleavage/methylation domain-containing protein [Candidatus Paceibacterota bacterium]